MNQYKLNLTIHEKQVLDVLGDCNCIIAGGFCLTKAQVLHGIQSSYNDIDIFFLDTPSFDKAHTMFIKHKKFRGGYDSAHAITFEFYFETDGLFSMEVMSQTIRIQLVKPFDMTDKENYETFEELVDDFDINNSKYFSVYPWTDIYTSQPKSCLTSLSISPQTNLGFFILHRVSKYHAEKSINLPNDPKENQRLLDFIKSPTNPYDMTRSNYDEPPGGFKQLLDSHFNSFLCMVYNSESELSKMITRGINNGEPEYLSLSKYLIGKGGGFKHSNFLFDYYFGRGGKWDIEMMDGEGLTKRPKVNKRIQEIYPELLL